MMNPGKLAVLQLAGQANQDPDAWRTPQFRQKMIKNIEEVAMIPGGPQQIKSPTDLENQVFQKAKSKEEYLSLITKLIIYYNDQSLNLRHRQTIRRDIPSREALVMIEGHRKGQQHRDIRKKEKKYHDAKKHGGLPGSGGVGMPTSGGPGGMPMGGAGPGGISHMGGPGGHAGGMGSQQSPQGGGPGGMMQDPLHALTNLTKGPSGPNMGLPPGQGQMLPGMQGNMMPPTGHPGGMGPPFHTYGGQMVGGPMGGQQGPRGMGPGPSMQGPRGEFMMTVSQGAGGMGQPPQGIIGPTGQMVSSQGMGQNPSLGPSYATAHSPAMLPSPSGGMMGVVPSPVSRPCLQSGAPSPSSGLTLNTPGNPNNPASVGSALSPAGKNTEDEKLYLEKLRHLQKYVEPLRRMITKIEKEEERKKDWMKMKNLLEILTDSTKRLPIETLSKCQQVLEKLGLENQKSAPVEISLPKAHMTLCQNLLDKVAAHAKMPMFNHTLKRTFGPALEALHGVPIRPPSPPLKRSRADSPPRGVVSPVLEGEIARLNRRFYVDLDPLYYVDSKNVHLICKLEDSNLPTVPPISVTVPDNYPSSSPSCDSELPLYEGTPFLQNVQKSLSSHLVGMPSRYSLTALLNLWEMSVRKATVATSVALKV